MGNDVKELMDDVNRRLAIVEQYFFEQQYVARAEVRLWTNDNYYLAWGKLANNYCLIIALMKDDEIVQQYPLKTASAEMRMRAIDQLDALEMALQDALKNMLATTREQSKKLDEWIHRRKRG